MPSNIGIAASAYVPKPEVTISAVTNYNQELATFNCVVNSNYDVTTVKFQYSTLSSFSAYTEVSAGTTTGINANIYYNVTGLSVGTTYYVRAVVSNNAGDATSSATSFTTWSLKTYLNTSAGSWSVSVPSVTPTGGSAIAPTIYEMLIYGGGGGSTHGGGGGGGYRIAASKTSSASGTQTVSGTIGAGGAGATGSTRASSGGNTTLTIGSTTYTAGGGTGGGWLTEAAGSSGSGDNVSYAGGTGYYGYTYFTGNYVQVVVGYNQYCCATNKYGACTQYCPDYNSPIYGNDYNQPIYATDYNRYSGGGGGGTDSAGSNASYPDAGGAGGNGGGAYGLRGGNGGGGNGTASVGNNGSTSGTGPIVGTGGRGYNASGVAGGVTFKYYGP